MADLIEEAVFETGIYQLEATDPVQGGANGIDNLQAKQLANRTKWLKENKQDKDAALSALAALVFAVDKMIYSTGADTFALATLTGFARTLLDDPDAATMRSTLGAVAAANAALTGTPTAPTAAAGTNTTQISTTAFVMNAIANLVASSPAALDTLNELAAALGDDPNFATTMTNALAGKQPLNTKLTALAALTLAADKLIYATGTGTLATTTLTAFSRTLLDDADGASVFASMGATQSIGASGGYFKLPNGIIVQWGKVSKPSAGLLPVTMPIAFPNNAFMAVSSIIYAGAISYFSAVYSLTNTVITLNSSNYGANYYETYIAIGN